MTAFLVWWGFTLMTLGTAVLVLHVLYRQFGSDLELGSWTRELIIVVVISALQALIMSGAHSVDNAGLHRAAFAGAAVITFFGYQITHLTDFEWWEAPLIAVAQWAIYVVILVLLLFLLV